MFNRLKELAFIWAVASPYVVLIYFLKNDYTIDYKYLLVGEIALFCHAILLLYYLYKKYYLE